MPQKKILLNLAQILEFNITEENRPELEKLIALLRQEDIGACFSFCICHGMMTQIGLLDWWEAVLKLSANWQWVKTSKGFEKFKELNLQVLNSSLQDLSKLSTTVVDPVFFTNKFKTNGNITGLDILVRVLNYIISHQCYLSGNFALSNIQHNLLEKNSKLLEIQNSQGITYKIEESESIGGNFTANKLYQLLNETAQENCFLIILSYEVKHVLHVWVDNGIWKIYDPNYFHDVDVATPIHKTFSCKADAVNEILSILKNDFVISALSLFPRSNHTFFPEFLKITDAESIKNLGLYHMAYSVDQIKFLLLQAHNNPVLCTLIGNILCNSISDFGHSTLLNLATQCPEYLSVLFALSNQNLDLCKGLAEGLNKTETVNGFTAFHQIVCSSNEFYSLLKNACAQTKNNQNQTLSTAIIKGLATGNVSGTTPLIFFFRKNLNDKKELENFYKLIKESSTIMRIISKSIGLQPRNIFEELKLKVPEFLQLVSSQMSLYKKRVSNDAFFKLAQNNLTASFEITKNQDKKRRNS